MERSVFTQYRQEENLSCKAVPGVTRLNQEESLAAEPFSMPVCHRRTVRDGFESGVIKHIMEYEYRFNWQKKTNVEF